MRSIMNIYYHNPKCTKSRQGLSLLEDRGISFEVREYLKDGLKVSELSGIYTLLRVHPYDAIRRNEQTFKDLGYSSKEDLELDAWYQIIEKNPILFERPLLKYNGKAIIGRPPEQLLEII